ncbi:hypothetical protein WJX84_003020 [Apatococcus fuscideae]|uniref:Uncharacterized protein n=1 Tax=Apatococcus fuscideae TaxID=2026836 RepID=A0AAW1SV75_9CHLO
MSARQLARIARLSARAANVYPSQPWTTCASPSASACCRHISSSATALQEPAEAAAPPATTSAPMPTDEVELAMEDLTPKEVVEMLDRYIVGQADAKRAVANALRNRWRRHRIPSPLKEEIVPKNILMIGPTGCGKTEIARRLAKLADAPFVKVEATKFTEVGFHGRDVDQIIRDLVDNAMVMTKQKLQRMLRAKIAEAIEQRIIDSLCGSNCQQVTKDAFRALYRDGQLDNRDITVEVPEAKNPGLTQLEGPGGMAVQEMFLRVDKMVNPKRSGQKRTMKVSEAKPIIEEAESDKLISPETVQREAMHAVQQDGIVFIDEIDKIVVNHETRYGADASSEGVQRDLLPIIEGSVVSTKYGNVSTDHILFICSGAFHSCKPSDMLAELQGRLPIRVELKGLTAGDFYRILTEPENNMIKQQQALLTTEGVDLNFTEDAIHEISRVAAEVNASIDNIGARRLHTVLERIVEEISFNAPERAKEASAAGADRVHYDISKDTVLERVGDLLKKQDLSRFVL